MNDDCMRRTDRQLHGYRLELNQMNIYILMIIILWKRKIKRIKCHYFFKPNLYSFFHNFLRFSIYDGVFIYVYVRHSIDIHMMRVECGYNNRRTRIRGIVIGKKHNETCFFFVISEWSIIQVAIVSIKVFVLF